MKTTSGWWVRALAAVTSCLLAACTHPTRVTAFTQGAPGGAPITRIAVAPAVSSIDRLVAGALRQEGCAVHDPTETAGILAAHHLDVSLLEKPEGLAALASEGVDALLIAAPDYPGWGAAFRPEVGDQCECVQAREGDRAPHSHGLRRSRDGLRVGKRTLRHARFAVRRAGPEFRVLCRRSGCGSRPAEHRFHTGSCHRDRRRRRHTSHLRRSVQEEEEPLLWLHARPSCEVHDGRSAWPL